MKTSFTAWISLSLFFTIICTMQASMANPIPTSEITVTLKLEWNVAVIDKPIPASYTTKVPNGTLLIDIMNKAADSEKQGPFDEYKSTYYSVMGYFITTINGIENDPSAKSYWMINDEQTGASLKCGVSSYVPVNGSTTLFRFTQFPSHSSHGNNANASGSCKSHSNIPVPPSAITVTIGMEWNPDVIKKPIPPPYTTKVASGTTLTDIINKAADENPEGPFNKYSSTYYGGQGHFITAMNGTKEDSTKDWLWKIYDKATGELLPSFVDKYKPQEGSTTILKFITSLESESGVKWHLLASKNEMAFITVTIALQWDAKIVDKPIPPPYTTKVSQGTFLIDIVKKAANEDETGPFNKYSTTYYGNVGDFVIAMDGVEQDPAKKLYWMIRDKQTGKLTPKGIDQYQPQDRSTTVFSYEEAGMSRYERLTCG